MGISRAKLIFIGNKNGFSLIEVLVAISIMAVVLFSLTTLMEMLDKGKAQSTLTQSATFMQNKIQTLLMNDTAWEETLASLTNADPANLGVAALSCIPNGTSCVHTVKPAPPTVPPNNTYYEAAPFIDMPILTEANGTRYINTTAPGNGFTYAGSPCNTFIDAPAGNDDCPLRWELKIAFICPNAIANCINPTVEIVGILKFRPSQPKSRFRIINDVKYRVSVARGARGRNRSEKFEAYYGVTGNGAGAGACTIGAWSPITLTLGLNENNNAAVAGSSLMLQPGTYNCSFSVSCFECGGLQGRLIYPSGSATAPAGIAGIGILARSSIDNATFSLGAVGLITLQYQAERIPFPTTNPNFCRGMGLPDYGSITKLAQLNCVRIY